MIKCLNNINKKQEEVILNTEGPMLILAGAGTGKTTTITNRFAHIISHHNLDANQVLAVTFTNKAAKEMQERIKKLISIDYELPWVGTFHGICLKIIRHNVDKLPINKNFSIIDRSDQKKIIKKILERYNIDSKLMNYVLEKIDYYKNQGQVPENEYIISNISGSKILNGYQEILTEMNVCDFNDLISYCISLWEKNPKILESYQKQFKYIMVDEYQDTNPIQYKWLKLLCQNNNNICCVGDEDQSIYSWRGADISNILSFEKDFPGAKVILLEENYRSTKPILETANLVISKNKQRKDKKLFSHKESNEHIDILSLFSDREEAKFIANQINKLKIQGQDLDEVAILVRTNFQMGPLEESLFQMGIPYKIVGGTRFYDRKEIKDLLAYLHIINDQNGDIYLERIINIPRRGIGNTTLNKIYQFMNDNRLPMFASIKKIIENKIISGKSAKQMADLIENIEFYSKYHIDGKPSEILDFILKFTNYIDLELDEKDNKAERIENINELRNSMESYSSISEFLYQASLMTDLDEDSPYSVKLMTIHAAKGLEFNTVFLAGWEEGLLPYQKNEEVNLEEERRLAYVAITRAKSKCFISFCRKRRIFNQINESYPSQFLLNLNPKYIKFHKI